jgi:hypothetical protein
MAHTEVVVEMAWQEAGRGWGASARNWAYFDALGVRISSEFGWIKARAADRAPAAPG